MFEVIIVLICLCLNAILSCIEMAYVTVSKPQLRKMAQSGDKSALRVLALKTNPERVLSVLQVGITLVGAISAAVSGAGAEEYLSPFFERSFGITEEWAETLAIISIVLPLTFVSVVFGELIPKTVALRFPVRFAKIGSYVLLILDSVFSPAVYVLEMTTRVFTNLFVKKHSVESLAETASSLDLDALTDSHKQYVFNMISVEKKRLKDILIPWNLVTTVSRTAHHTDVIELIRTEKHTRIPVLDDDTPIGILHAKEFISEIEVSKVDWLALVRPPIFLSPDEPILNVLKLLQLKKSHMGIVRKNQTVLGIVTIEDILEEVVGEIHDEDDTPRTFLSNHAKLRTPRPR